MEGEELAAILGALGAKLDRLGASERNSVRGGFERVPKVAEREDVATRLERKAVFAPLRIVEPREFVGEKSRRGEERQEDA